MCYRNNGMQFKKAISLDSITKTYRLYKRNSDRIKETFHPFRKQYHKPFPALKTISFSINHQESVGIIGRNGSGKSTLLQILCGVLQPSSGHLSVEGKISALLELGAGFNPEFTGRENVYLSATIMGFSTEYIDKNIDKIFEFADIGEYVDQPVKLYSSGMFVRLAFATAISVDPDILIVDEALSVGDIFFQQKCMEHMKRMMDSKTIVLVSHDMHAVSNLCDRVIVLNDGEILFDGDTSEGIALYIRLMHNEMFAGDGSNGAIQEQIPAHILGTLRDKAGDLENWISISARSRGGAEEIIVHSVSITKDDEIVKVIETGEKVTVKMLISSARDFRQVIFGYTVKDRLGVAVFGENSVSLLQQAPSLVKGFSYIVFDFRWPEVQPQEYTLTLGIGEGSHPFDHKIQCWAHNVSSFAATTAPGTYVHGIFNNKLESLEMVEL